MSIDNNTKESYKRYDLLRNATLLKYFSEIDIDEEMMELNYSILTHFITGDLDRYFYSSYLLNIDESKKNDIFAILHKYAYLCFYSGKSEFWLDSIEGVPSNDSEFICIKILDNINFLIRLALNCDSNVFTLLDKFLNMDDFNDSSVIEILRNKFSNDDILERILFDMSKTDTSFKCFNDEQLAILCKFPEGILYYTDVNEVIFSNPVFLFKRIQNKYFKDNDDSDFYDISKDDFEDTVFEMYLNYANI